MAEKSASAQATSLPESSHDDSLYSVQIDPTIEKRILRRLDFRVVPVLWALFLVSFVDRGNIGNAKIQGMEEELHLVGNDYNTAVWVFTLAYVVFGVPANVLFRMVGPKSLSVMMFCWGLTVLGQGLTKSYTGLVICRFLEGICEAGFVPGCASLIGSYYKRDEFLKRYVVFFSAAIVAGAFNGLFARLLAKMDGIGSYAGWRWIFIIESLITIVFSLISFFVIVDFPSETNIFSTEEKRVLLARLYQDAAEPYEDKQKTWWSLLDWKILAATLAYIGAEENASSVVFFQPTILKGLGYTADAAQVISIPIYCVAFVISLSCCFASEFLRQRYLFAMVGTVFNTTGLAIELAQPRSAAVRYAGMFFLTSGSYIIMPITVVWLAINVGKGFKRTVALGMVIAVGNCGAFISSNVFITKETPKFPTGFGVGMGMTWLSGIFLTVLYIGMFIGNRQKEARRRQLPLSLNEREYGGLPSDKHPDFRYSL
ncbi:MAG: hypothetical protein M1820_009399 [Bogoriella megaspora]|nr:MAG: hypothetical protein M1820_009399 [Bogoriella megaspora]